MRIKHLINTLNAVLLLSLLLVGCVGSVTPTLEPTSLSTTTPTGTPRPTTTPAAPTDTPQPTPTLVPMAPSATVSPTAMPVPSISPRPPTATLTPTPRPSATLAQYLSTLQVIGPQNAAWLAPLVRLGTGQVSDFAWSPDGKTLAVATSLGVYLTDAATLTQIRSMPMQSRMIAVTFSPDGVTLAGAAADNTVRLWAVNSGELLHTLWGHTTPAGLITFSPDGQRLVSGMGGGTLRFWDVNTGQELWVLKVDAVFRQFILSPNQQWLALGGGKMNNLVKIWDLGTGEMVRQLEIQPDLAGMAFSPDSTMLAAAESGRTAVLWHLNTGQARRLQHPNLVWNVVFSPDGSLLATTGDKEMVTLWEVATGEVVRTLKGDAAAFSPDGTQLATTGSAGVQLWDLAAGQALHPLPADPGIWGSRLAFSPDGSRLAYDSAGTVRVLDLSKWQAQPLLGPAISIFSLAFSRDGQRLASGHYGSVILWDLATGQALRSLTEHTGQVCGLAFSPDSQTLASSSQNGDETVRLWDVASGRALKILSRDSNDPAYRLVFSADGGALIGIDRRGAMLWDVTTGEMRRLGEAAQDVQSLAMSADGKWLAIGSADGIVVWDLELRQVIRTLAAQKPAATSLAFSPDGTMLVSADWVNRTQVWDVSTGQLLRTLEGNSVTLSPDGALLVMLGLDHTVLWDMAADREIRRLPRGWPIAFSPDGRRLALGSEDGTIVLWGAE